MDTRGQLLDVNAGRIIPVATFYKASELIGEGRFSEVYRAYDRHSETDVALKIYRGHDPATHQLAKNEQTTLQRLESLNSRLFPRLRKAAKHRINNSNHPVLVLELGSYQTTDSGDRPVISLLQVLDEAARPHGLASEEFWAVDQIVDWLVRLVQGVVLMHEADVVHRDIKPANILLRKEAGKSEIVPFFLDFNSSAGPGSAEVRSGTRLYLPPEVQAGRRNEPSRSDDVWAVAMVCWEVLHGLARPVEASIALDARIIGAVPTGIIKAVHSALQLRAEDRFATAHEFLAALEQVRASTRGPAKPAGPPPVSAQEFASATARAASLRMSMEEALAAPGEIVVPKATSDAVSTLLTWLSEEQTQSLDLVGELRQLGPRALPVCLQQGYKLAFDTRTFDEIVEGLRLLAREDPELATRAVEEFALSSNLAVRRLCRKLAEEMAVLPAPYIEALTSDDGVLTSVERLEIAELCLRFGTDSGAMLALSKYLCREYLLGPDRYQVLAKRVAGRMGEMPYSDKALLVVEDTESHIWEELSEFDRIPREQRPECEKGLLELMADAFAAMGDAALAVLVAGKVPRQSGGDPPLPIFRRFATKLALRHAGAREWVIRQASSHPDDGLFKKVAEALQAKTGSADPDELRRTVEAYLAHGQTEDLNTLRFSADTRVFSLLDARIRNAQHQSIGRVLNLLKGYQSRQRSCVVDFVLRHWSALSAEDYAKASAVLTVHGVPVKSREAAVKALSGDLNGKNDSAARDALERILG